jgi:hypothetical protein
MGAGETEGAGAGATRLVQERLGCNLLQYGAHALLELGDWRLACGASDGSWRGGVHGSADFYFFIFLRILLIALQRFLRPVSPIGSICASPSRPF